MKKKTLFFSFIIPSAISLTNCSSKIAETPSAIVSTEVSPSIESATSTSPTAEEETSVTERATESSSIATETTPTNEETLSASTSTYSLSDNASDELSLIFSDCYYSGLGHNKALQFASLTQDEASALLFWTLLNPGTPLYQGTDLSYDGLSKYSVPYTTAKEFFMQAFAADLDSYDFSNYTEGDSLIWHGGDYGSDVPGAIINSVTQSPDTGLITITGDAFYIYDVDMSVMYAKFTATMVPSNSSYFDGNTLVSFTYEDNTSDEHPDIDVSQYF